ncbi:MAG: NAD-dependent epimerase/dehydratase family protein [Chloroflexaceae bacterium]|nr:NAD-dependent epimerase/dehydratase family protein [Chloroflexaceae bacterium]
MTEHTLYHADIHTPVRQTYLVTGGAGFIGSHLVEMLLQQGHRVLVIDDLSTGLLENIVHLRQHPNFHFARASITNELVLDRLTSEADIVIHLAAAVGVKLIVENPVRTIETNIMGTEAVLRAAVRYGARVLVASTSEVYGKGTRIPFREDDDVVLGPTSRNRWGYAASKMLDEFLALAYYREQNLPVVLFRLFNTVGPRQRGQYGMVIPRFVQQALAGEPLTVYDDGEQSRCFLHVTDAVRAILALAERDEAIGQVFNIGATEEITIRGLAERVLAEVDTFYAAHPERSAPPRPAERLRFVSYAEAYHTPDFEDMRQRVPDISKIYQHTGWHPERSLKDILCSVVQHMAG